MLKLLKHASGRCKPWRLARFLSVDARIIEEQLYTSAAASEYVGPIKVVHITGNANHTESVLTASHNRSCTPRPAPSSYGVVAGATSAGQPWPVVLLPASSAMLTIACMQPLPPHGTYACASGAIATVALISIQTLRAALAI